MAATRRTTLYLDPDVHRALRMKAAVSDRSLSDLVNDAVRAALAEDAADLAAFEERASEPDLAFEDVLRDLKRRGKL
ncbi:CopG family transcriptional regulator [Candidatus Bipolaricaulota bacterium]|nr:CopG family transcriptional regulator [Candidatus Bipolaricaulota bacterium]